MIYRSNRDSAHLLIPQEDLFLKSTLLLRILPELTNPTVKTRTLLTIVPGLSKIKT